MAEPIDTFRDIAYGVGDNIWAVGQTTLGPGGGAIMKLVNGNWQIVSGLAQSIDVDYAGNPWIVSAIGEMFKGDPNGNFVHKAASAGVFAIDIGVSGNGNVWIIDNANHV